MVFIDRNHCLNEAEALCVDWRFQASKRCEIGTENARATIIIVEADWRSRTRADLVPMNSECRTAFAPFMATGWRKALGELQPEPMRLRCRPIGINRTSGYPILAN